jgi:DNA-directed RNA polymerase specialized sigma24 family protein
MGSDQEAEPPGGPPRAQRAPYNWQQSRQRRQALDDDLTDEQRWERDRDRLLTMELGEGFDGPTWDLIAADTWSYLVRVLPGMIRNGKLANRRRQLIRRRSINRGELTAEIELSIPANLTEEEVEDLAHEVTFAAMKAFHSHLSNGRWDKSKDIAFRSWAVNTAAWKLDGPLRRLLRNRQWSIDPKRTRELTGDEFDRPESVIHVVDFERALSRFPNQVHATMIQLDVDGLTDEAIAKATQRTVKQVEYGLKRARSRLTRLYDRASHDEIDEGESPEADVQGA